MRRAERARARRPRGARPARRASSGGEHARSLTRAIAGVERGHALQRTRSSASVRGTMASSVLPPGIAEPGTTSSAGGKLCRTCATPSSRSASRRTDPTRSATSTWARELSALSSGGSLCWPGLAGRGRPKSPRDQDPDVVDHRRRCRALLALRRQPARSALRSALRRSGDSVPPPRPSACGRSRTSSTSRNRRNARIRSSDARVRPRSRASLAR